MRDVDRRRAAQLRGLAKVHRAERDAASRAGRAAVSAKRSCFGIIVFVVRP